MIKVKYPVLMDSIGGLYMPAPQRATPAFVAGTPSTSAESKVTIQPTHQRPKRKAGATGPLSNSCSRLTRWPSSPWSKKPRPSMSISNDVRT